MYVYMRMCSSYLSIVAGIASKQLHNILSAIIVLLTPCMECCNHAGIVYTFQSIEKKVKKGRIKES